MQTNLVYRSVPNLQSTPKSSGSAFLSDKKEQNYSYRTRFTLPTLKFDREKLYKPISNFSSRPRNNNSNQIPQSYRQSEVTPKRALDQLYTPRYRYEREKVDSSSQTRGYQSRYCIPQKYEAAFTEIRQHDKSRSAIFDRTKDFAEDSVSEEVLIDEVESKVIGSVDDSVILFSATKDCEELPHHISELGTLNNKTYHESFLETPKMVYIFNTSSHQKF